VVVSLSFAYQGKAIIAKEPSVIYFTLGKYYFNNNDFDNALNYFKKAIEINPKFAEAHHNLGIVYYNLNEKNGAVDELKNAIRLNGGYAKAYYSLALVYYESKDYGNVLQNLLKVIELEPENANAHFDLAVVYVDRFREKELTGNISLGDLEDLEEALLHYLKVAELDFNFPHALINAEIVKNIINDYEAKLKQ
jgi:tetratricopeptide (TPR) repeat protein